MGSADVPLECPFLQSEPLSQLPLGIPVPSQLYSPACLNNPSGAASLSCCIQIIPTLHGAFGAQIRGVPQAPGCSCFNDIPHPTKSCRRREWDHCGAGCGIIGNRSRDLLTSRFLYNFPTCCFRNCFGTPGRRNADVGSTSGCFPIQRFSLFLLLKEIPEAQHSFFKESVVDVPKSFSQVIPSPHKMGKLRQSGQCFPTGMLGAGAMSLPRGKIIVDLPQNHGGRGQKIGTEPAGNPWIQRDRSQRSTTPNPPYPPLPHPGTLGISIPPSLRAWKTILEVIPFDLLLIPDNCLQA